MFPKIQSREKKPCGSGAALAVCWLGPHHSGVAAFPFLAVSHCCADGSGEEIRRKEWVKIVWEWVPWYSASGWVWETRWWKSAYTHSSRSDHQGSDVSMEWKMSLRGKAQSLLSPQAPRSGGDCSDFCSSLLIAYAGCGISMVDPAKVGILSSGLLLTPVGRVKLLMAEFT